ncbi:hypothetical protein [Faecalibacterium wellingii]|uniref:Uncharacterized protein n=1 Tax=Faecalibacterium wellingii TaxID=2929491 RepID=A0ABU3U061_9FIRM|nr:MULTISPECIES: hypothetical protein [Faecalibacterium]MDU8688938.1 hypothetical protein [Faecalibacterium prausnitzii]UQK56552.1 hypothetical protein MTP37_00110 [Faecalibacterium sp. HTF-F]
MKKTRRFVALLLAAVLALALFTACGAAQPTIGEEYEKWFVEQLNSKLPEGKTVQKVDVKHSEMMAALAKIDKDGKFTAGEGWDEGEQGIGPWYWIILSDPHAWIPGVSEAKAVALAPENLTQYGPTYLTKEGYLNKIREYDIATRVMDGKTYVAVYLHLERWY